LWKCRDREEATFSHEQLQQLLALAEKGLKELAGLQTAFSPSTY